MQITSNTIFQLNSNSNKIIQHLINHYKKVILVIDDKNNTQFDNIYDFRGVNIHSTLIKDRQLITRHRFFFLVRRGLLSGVEYDCIIFRLQKLDSIEISTFKIFYYNNIKSRDLCAVFAFLGEINEMDSIYLHSKRFFLPSDDKPAISPDVKIVVCKPTRDDSLWTYLRLKNALTYNTDEVLESVSYQLAFEKMVEYLKNNKHLVQKASNYKQTDVSEKEYERLNVIHRKFLLLKELLENNKGKKIYVACKRSVILNYVDFFNEHETDVDLLIYYDVIDVNVKADKYLFIADDNACFANIVKICKSIKRDDRAYRLFRYVNESEEKISTKKGAYVEKSVAHVFLARLLCNLKHLFEQHFLFIANLEYTDVHYSSNKGFVCHLKLPYVSCDPVFTESHISQVEKSKRAALQDAAFKAIKGLMACGCLDENLSLIKEYFIINKVYKSWLESTYKIENNYLDRFDTEYQKNISSINTYPLEYFFSILIQNENNEQPVFITHVYTLIFKLMQHVVNSCDSTYVKNVFKQKYMVTLKKANFPKIKSRAIPKCFLNLNLNHLYAFNSDTGIICGKTFQETIELESASFEYLGEIDTDDQQMSLIALYNVLFFGIHYKKIGYNSTYNYFVVPLKNKKLFLNGFAGNLYENQEYTGYLLFNPFNKNFYVFKDWSDQSINDNVIRIDNGSNVDDHLLKEENDSNGELISYLKYFEQKYGTHLKYTADSDKRLMFNGYIYSHRGKGSASTSLLSSEIMRVTPCIKDIFEKYVTFTYDFIYFEVLALVDEARVGLNLPISLKLLSNCFISKNDKYPDYERLEFLGDCILKYLVTKFFMLCFEYDTGSIVDSKCRIIENSNLTLIGKKLELESYFSNLVFQPPSLNDNICKQLQQYFNFKNTAFNSQTAVCNQISSEKTYADIVEAIIGACYVENDLSVTERMIFQLGIIDISKYSDNIVGVFDETDGGKSTRKKQKISTDKFLRDIFELDGDVSMEVLVRKKTFDFFYYLDNCNNGTFFRCNRFLVNLAEHHNVMSEENIAEVEGILDYKFRNKGFIEKAMIHPSTRDNMFGTRSYFEKLELIGDSVLDVFVTKSIFNQYSCPFALHEARKNLVNNQIYGNVLYTSKLFNYIETCFDKDELRNSYLVNNYKKLYGDIFEAINGAILLDLDFRTDLYEKVWESRIKEWLWTCYKVRKSIE
ncbi:hypothetical protein VCUG_01130 [Vavraia culicis subsp. floridensis]|uniref:RNase III domain-containing protein n=1 Tax=Vavraia culicis (isolate floridensis) TaxID=948595 RepID=L2GUN6_VAVCU|nr:uncharacterized protein VCUG_01130 [Vavraia culicis subsp. floridensis]ELA47361.1 hypothetical protein VCUG_01130 [Vavraia culicis subsp. floridensis]